MPSWSDVNGDPGTNRSTRYGFTAIFPLVLARITILGSRAQQSPAPRQRLLRLGRGRSQLRAVVAADMVRAHRLRRAASYGRRSRVPTRRHITPTR